MHHRDKKNPRLEKSHTATRRYKAKLGGEGDSEADKNIMDAHELHFYLFILFIAPFTTPFFVFMVIVPSIICLNFSSRLIVAWP